MHNLELSLILQEVHRLSDRFEMVQFQHIYHERNNLADSLAKEGARICEGHWLIKEQREDSIYETYQIFWFDLDNNEFLLFIGLMMVIFWCYCNYIRLMVEYLLLDVTEIWQFYWNSMILYESFGFKDTLRHYMCFYVLWICF